MRYSGLRTLAQLAAGRPPGPEASVAKLFWSEYHKRLGEIAMGIEGADGLLRPDGDGYPVSSWQSVFLGSRAGTIYSGTGFAGPLTAVHPRARTAFRPAGRAEPARPARAGRPSVRPGAGPGGRGCAGRHGRGGHPERGGPGLRLPGGGRERPDAPGGAGRPRDSERRHRARPELPGLRQRAYPGGTLRAEPAAAADRRTGRHGAAERRPGQRGARLRPARRAWRSRISRRRRRRRSPPRTTRWTSPASARWRTCPPGRAR